MSPKRLAGRAASTALLAVTLLALDAFVARDGLLAGEAQGESGTARLALAAHRFAVARAIQGAADQLADARCQALLDEFADASGRPLRSVLAAHGLAVSDYMRQVFFYDAPEWACRAANLAVTKPGSRAIFVCGARFQKEMSRNSQQCRGDRDPRGAALAGPRREPSVERPHHRARARAVRAGRRCRAGRQEHEVTGRHAPCEAQPRVEASGVIREARSFGSRVTSGTLWTTLVAAISSSAGSLRTSRRVLVRAISAVIGHTSTAARVRTTSAIVQVDFDPSELRELGDLPQHDGRNAPTVAGEQLALALRQVPRYGVQQDVGVKIEHPSGLRSRGCRP